MDNAQVAERLMTVRDMAEYLNFTETTIRSMAKGGELPGFKIGHRWRFKREEVEMWLQDNGSNTNRGGDELETTQENVSENRSEL